MLRRKPQLIIRFSIAFRKISIKLIDRAVDFSLLHEAVAGSDCRHFGRPAKEPELMAKLLLLAHIYDP